MAGEEPYTLNPELLDGGWGPPQIDLSETDRPYLNNNYSLPPRLVSPDYQI